MAYATLDDLKARWGYKKLAEITNDTASTAVDEDRAALALRTAEDIVHSMLAPSAYLTPLVGMNEADASLLREIVCRRAFALLYEWRLGKDLDAEGRPVHPAREHQKFAEQQVRLIATNLLKISAKKTAGPSGAVAWRRNVSPNTTRGCTRY